MQATKPPGRPMSQERENALLDAAIEVLSEVGFDQMTVKMVCDTAGASTKTAYKRWPNKEALLTAAFQRAVLREIDTPLEVSKNQSLRDNLIDNLTHQANSFRGSTNLVLGLIVAAQQAGELGKTAKMLIRKNDARYAEQILATARDRQELQTLPSAERIADVARSFFIHHVLVLGGAPTEEAIISFTDDVLLPTIHHSSK